MPFQEKIQINKNQIYGSPYTTARQIQKEVNMKVHQEIRSKKSVDELECKLERAIRGNHQNLDRYSPIRDGDEAYENYLLS
jgi:hypothetical protein